MLNAQQQAITVQKQKVTNLINLYKALGGGVEVPTTVAQNTKEN
jgi:outer membrane protein TolC